MEKLLFLFALPSLLLVHCTSDTNTKKNTTAAAPAETIRLICQPVSGDETMPDMPRYEIFIQIGDSKIKVDDVSDCSVIGAGEYAQYQIPASAISAAGGWWAGAGDYFYVVREGESYVVKQGGTDEKKADNDFGYRTVLTLPNDGF